MEKLYIDESGTMTATYCDIHPYFIICIIRAKDPKRLKRAHKRFVSSRANVLKAVDSDGKMFRGDKFIELKGNAFTPELKRDFIDYFCKNDLFDLFYIITDNKKIARRDNGKMYENTARAFNYLIKLSLTFFIRNKCIGNEGFHLQLDERNEKTETKHFLENYLNTELYLTNVIENKCKVHYFDSCDNTIIQVADVFANIMFSELKTSNYTKELEKMKTDGYINNIFRFPLK